MSGACAAIDVGTNTTLLVVGEPDGAGGVRVLEDRAEVTRLGRGIGAGEPLGRAGIDATLAALSDYADAALRHRARLRAIGTEGLRRAPNAGEFLAPAAGILGTPVEIIDGEREAALTFLATSRSFPREAAGLLSVVDIGGGSTEIVIADGGRIEWRGSLPLGSVRLTEQFVRRDPPREAEIANVAETVAKALLPVPFRAGGVLAGVAGTVTSLAAMALALASYDSGRVHGIHLTRAALASEIARLRRSTQAERERMVGLDPRRADVILAGALVLAEVARRAAVPHVLVSDRGIRWGLLHEMMAEP